MPTEIIPNRLYNEEEVRDFLGGVGKTKMRDYIKKGLIAPARKRPSMFTGTEVIDAMSRITEYNRTVPKTED